MTVGISPAELAEILTKAGRPVSTETIRRHCREGRIAAERVGRTFVIPEKAAAEYIETYTRYAHKSGAATDVAAPGTPTERS